MHKVTYLEHSGFFLELDTCCVMFDYWKGDIPDVGKPYYVFVSHAHEDHFNPVVFELLKRTKPTHIIVSSDVKAIRHACVHVMKPEETLIIDQVSIQTLTSTDEGVAFVVKVDDTTIYHAGDLHWWHWDEESSVEENKAMKDAYLAQLAKIKDIEIDIAFVVFDPRLDEQTSWGLDAFLEHCHAKYVFPMHFWGDVGAIDRYKKEKNSDITKVISIHHKQEEFTL